MRLKLFSSVMLILAATSAVVAQTGATANLPTAQSSPSPVAPLAPATPPSASSGAIVAPPSPFSPPAPATPEAGTVTLRYKFTPGQVLKYRMTMNMNMATGAAGRSFNTTTTGGGDMTYTVQSVDASGNATVLVQATSFDMATKLNGQTIAMPASATDALKKGYTVVLSPTGKMVSMSGLGTQAGGMDINQLMNSSGLGGLSQLPDQPVKVGDVWRASSSLGAMGGQIYTKMSLVGISTSGGHTTATIASKVSMDMSHDMPSGAGSMKMNMQGDGHGKSTFDADSGTLIGMDMTMDSDTSTSIPSAAASSSPLGAMKMHMVMDMGMQLEGS